MHTSSNSFGPTDLIFSTSCYHENAQPFFWSNWYQVAGLEKIMPQTGELAWIWLLYWHDHSGERPHHWWLGDFNPGTLVSWGFEIRYPTSTDLSSCSLLKVSKSAIWIRLGGILVCSIHFQTNPYTQVSTRRCRLESPWDATKTVCASTRVLCVDWRTLGLPLWNLGHKLWLWISIGWRFL